MQIKQIHPGDIGSSNPMTTKTARKRELSLAFHRGQLEQVIVGEFRPSGKELQRMAKLGTELTLNATESELVTYRTWT